MNDKAKKALYFVVGAVLSAFIGAAALGLPGAINEFFEERRLAQRLITETDQLKTAAREADALMSYTASKSFQYLDARQEFFDAIDSKTYKTEELSGFEQRMKGIWFSFAPACDELRTILTRWDRYQGVIEQSLLNHWRDDIRHSYRDSRCREVGQRPVIYYGSSEEFRSWVSTDSHTAIPIRVEIQIMSHATSQN